MSVRKEQKVLTEAASEKALDAIALVEASLSDIKPYDVEKYYTPKDREPYDAFSSRFSRAVEVCLKFFRSYEKLMYGENSETIRDLLHRMEKLDFIDSVEQWLEMRDIRNRIVHDYLPDDIKEIYDSIMGPFGKQLRKVRKKIKVIIKDRE
ncbi:MAG TPA: nucleotidyltransferase substrate binding protein [Candidatus Deferrimicrobium sp.]|nr:nucleotidyltransferase substrate binding protein [Candidatus Deferrimicrobium sp.]